MRGGMIGPTRGLGGMPRTFGLHRDHHWQDADPQAIQRASVRRVAPYFRPYLGLWIVITLCLAAISGLEVLNPLCVRGIIDHALASDPVDLWLLQLLVGAMVALTVISSLISMLQSYLSARVGQSMMCDLRNGLYTHLQRMSLHFFTATRAGEIVSRINNDVGAVQGVATGTVVSIAQNVFRATATITAMFLLNWQLAVLALVIVPAFYFPTRVVGKIRHKLSTATQEEQALLVGFMQERLHVGGMLLTKLFGQSHADRETFTARSRGVRDLNVKQVLAGQWLFMCLRVISVAGPALIWWFGGYQLYKAGAPSVGTIVAFVGYLGNLYHPMQQLANFYVDVQGSLAVFERIFEFQDLKPEVEDRPDATELESVSGHIVFDRVSFSYPLAVQYEGGPPPEAGKPGETADAEAEEAQRLFALNEISFEILPGEQVALVGPSGAGKSTITYLVPRFYDPTDGAITLDGYDLRDLTQESLRSHMAVVTQETFLFHDTIRENLFYAKPDATEAELVQATKAANIHEFIESLPDGYDTIVGERGFRLSGGEKQRISIARAILKNPRILILDEATSSLDATSEHLVQEALATLLEGRTSLIIAHRLSTILSADKIVALDDGRVVECGPHEELIARGGLYATLYEQQFAKVVEQTLALVNGNGGGHVIPDALVEVRN